MPREKNRVEAALRSKGFVEGPGDHRYFVYHTADGRKAPIRTKTSHTPKMKDIPDNILAQMARQCSLTKAQFLDLVDCPMDRAAYEAALREQGKL